MKTEIRLDESYNEPPHNVSAEDYAAFVSDVEFTTKEYEMGFRAAYEGQTDKVEVFLNSWHVVAEAPASIYVKRWSLIVDVLERYIGKRLSP